MDFAVNNLHIAKDFLDTLNAKLVEDQGATYRKWLGIVMPTIGDAYSSEESKFRSHMGASLIGRGCDREVWYGFNWAKHVKHEGRMIRLFNRGHMEEGRFIAMLLTIGAVVVQQDENGKQYRISDAGGHFGGAGDGVAKNIPGLPPDMWALTEFKTHNDKSFAKLSKEGVRLAKPEHFTQMQIYMRKMGLPVALYVAVNKNTDEIWAEFVQVDVTHSEFFFQRAKRLIPIRVAPEKAYKTIGAFGCKFCDYKEICHLDAKPDVNCRTCVNSVPIDVERSDGGGSGQWACKLNNVVIDKQQQLAACPNYTPLF